MDTAFKYDDGIIEVHGIWLGTRNAKPIDTCYSSMGCLCSVPLSLQHRLPGMFFRPNSGCSSMCVEPCAIIGCSDPQVINQLFINSYEVTVLFDHPRIVQSGEVAEAARQASLGKSSYKWFSVYVCVQYICVCSL